MRHRTRLLANKGLGLVCALALAFMPAVSALALPNPSARALAPALQQQQKPNAQPPDPSQTEPQAEPKTVTISGTIVKTGSDYVLKDTSGAIYRLDTPDKAEPFEGKPVKVTGKLDVNAHLLHVDSIEAIAA